MDADVCQTLSIECFNKTFDRLAKKSGNKFSFIMKAGDSFKSALFNICKRVWETESIPQQWSSSELVQLYKGSGPTNQLQNYRFIHMKDEVAKFFGNLVMDQAKDTIYSNMSKFQIGTRPGHRAQEHLFVLKNVIALYSKYDKPLILSTWDVSKFFDSECLTDVMNELHRNQIRGKLYRLLYLLNENVRIRVNTPVGPTQQLDTGETLGQGSVEGAVASAVNLDNGVRDFFENSENEVYYHGLKLGPLLFQDDIARLSTDLSSAQSGNERMRNVAESKLIDFNIAKSGFLILAKGKRRRELMKELSIKPLTLCDQPMKQMKSIKYLGDYLSELGLAESVKVTVNNRKGLVNRAIFEIKSVLNDCRAHLTGGLVSGFDIWEIAVIPSLLYNAETWQDIARKTVEELETIQLTFLRSLLGVGSGCPTVLLYSETGTLLMEYRILQKKLLFLHHLHNLPESSLASEVLAVQTEQGLPGIVDECHDFLAKFEIYDLTQYSKYQFKRIVKQKIKELNKSKLLDIAKSKQYKKVNFNDLSCNDFKLKQYFKSLNIADSKLRFKIESQMVPSVKVNFQSDKKYAKELWACDSCLLPGEIGFRDTQQHIKVCRAFESLREGRDLTKDAELVAYFKEVMKARI